MSLRRSLAGRKLTKQKPLYRFADQTSLGSSRRDQPSSFPNLPCLKQKNQGLSFRMSIRLEVAKRSIYSVQPNALIHCMRMALKSDFLSPVKFTLATTQWFIQNPHGCMSIQAALLASTKTGAKASSKTPFHPYSQRGWTQGEDAAIKCVKTGGRTIIIISGLVPIGGYIIDTGSVGGIMDVDSLKPSGSIGGVRRPSTRSTHGSLGQRLPKFGRAPCTMTTVQAETSFSIAMSS
jgi:hypothetical protein